MTWNLNLGAKLTFKDTCPMLHPPGAHQQAFAWREAHTVSICQTQYLHGAVAASRSYKSSEICGVVRCSARSLKVDERAGASFTFG